MSLELAVRFVGGVLAGIVAWDVALPLIVGGSTTTDPATAFVALFLIVGASFGIGFLLTPYLTTRPYSYLLDAVTHAPPADVVAGTVGLLVGLGAAALLAGPLSALPWIFGWVLPVALSLVLGYLGLTTALAQRRELLALVGLPWEFSRTPGASDAGRPVVVDTSTIIDGRVADIARTGFLEGPLIVPSFVLAELQRIADSPDAVRRQRGRRGLDILARLQRDATVDVQIMDADTDAAGEVDAQLVTLAQGLRCPILTNDFNLNRVAGIQGVKVLNVNELAGAVKTTLLAGEEMTVRVIQEGKEFGQGVGYLDDGTMVVVENGRHLLNSTAQVVVSRVLQTVAGRMIFAQPRPGQTHTYPNGSAPGGRP